jgi:hypothetical protein
MPLDYIEFSKKIKTKYPEYSDVDDLTLARKMVEKYPEYKNEVTFGDEPVKKKEVSQSIFDQGGFSSAMSKMAQNQPSVSSVEKDKYVPEEKTITPKEKEPASDIKSLRQWANVTETKTTPGKYKTDDYIDVLENKPLKKNKTVSLKTDEYVPEVSVTEIDAPTEKEAETMMAEDFGKKEFNAYQNISKINKDIIFKSEKDAVKELREKFKGSGFIFEETGIGNTIKISTSTDGGLTTINSMELDLVNPSRTDTQTGLLGALGNRDKQGEEAYSKLTDFMNKSILKKTDKDFLNKEVKDYGQLVNLMADNPYKYGEEFLNQYSTDRWFDSRYKDLVIESKSLKKNEEELLLEYDNFVKNPTSPEGEAQLKNKINSLEERKDILKSQYNDLGKLNEKLKVSSAVYYKNKEKQGNTLGLISKSFIKGAFNMEKALLGVAADVMPYVLPKGSMMPDVQREKLKASGMSDVEINDYASKQLRSSVIPQIEKGLTDLVSFGTKDQYIQSEDRNDLEKVASFLSESIGTAVSSGGNPLLQKVAFFSQSYNVIEDEMNSSDFDGLSQFEKKLISVPYAMTIGALERVGFKFTTGVQKNPLFNKLVNNIVFKTFSNLPKDASATLMQNELRRNTGAMLAATGLRIVGGALVEGGVEGVQQLDEIAIKNISNAITDKDYFKNVPDITTAKGVNEALGAAATDFYYGALGGLIMSAGSESVSAIRNGYNNRRSDDEFAVFSNSLKDNNLRSSIESDIKSKIVSGDITKEEAKAQIESMNKSYSILQSIPDKLNTRDQRESFNLILEKQKITKETEGKDPALVTAQTERINEINEELKTISKNAIQVQTASKVPLQPEARVGEEVVQGESETEPQSVTEEGQEVEVLRAKEQEEIRAKFPDAEYKADGKIDADKLSVKDRKAFDKIYAKYDKLISPLLKPTEITIDKPVIAKNAAVEVDRVKALPVEAEDGATFNLDGAKYEGVGLVVPVDSMNTTIEELTPEMVADFVEERQKMIGDAGVVKAGIYKFPNSNQVSIDLSIVVPESSREQAIEFGRLADQESLFDLATYENVKTGGTGNNPMKFTPEQHREIAKALKEGRLPNVFTQADNQTVSDQDNLITQDNFEEQRSKQTTAMGQRIVTAAKLVMKALPGVKIYIHQTTAEFENGIGQKLTKASKGAYDNGDIHINLESGADLSTLYHEAIHYALEVKGIESGAILDLAKGLQSIVSDKSIKDRLANLIEVYNENEKAEEYIVELGAIMAEAKKELTTTKFQQFKNLINRIAKKLGLPVIFSASSNAKDAVDFMNSLIKAIRTGEEIKAEEVTKKGKIKFQYDFSDPLSKLTFVYDKNGEKFNKFKKEGYITDDKNLSDFEGKFIFLHQPDAAFSGMIYKDGEILVEGKGGVFYPIKFHDDGYFWASTNTTAEKMVKDLNKVFDQNNGTIYMALTSAPYDKLMSSTTMSNAVLDFFSSKAFDNNFKITPTQLKVALRKAANDVKIKKSKDEKTGQIKEKKEGLDLSIKTETSLNDIQSQIKKALNSDNSSFADRKNFALELIKLMANKIKSDPKATEQFGKLFSEGIQNKYFKGISKTGKLSISAANMTQAISEMFTEPLLKEDVKRKSGGQVYAIIELNSKVKQEPSTKHESYPIAIESENKNNKVKIHILQDRKNWADSFIDPETGETVSKDRQQKLFPTSGVSVMGLQLKGKSNIKFQRISPENSSNYANLTEDGKGNFVFFHRGGNDYEVIKKSSGGTTATSRDEASAISKVGGVAMYYTRPTDAETMVQGTSQYAVKVKNDKVYDFNSDPLNIIKEARERFNREYPGQAFNPNVQFAYVTKIANEKGYDMTVAEWDGRTRAQSVVEFKPDDVQVTKGNQVVKNFDESYESNTDKGFQSVIPEDKQKKLDAVYAKIYSVRNSEARYDDLYRLQEESAKLTEDQITDMIVNSDLSQEIKDEYQAVINAPVEKRRTIKFQRVTKVTVNEMAALKDQIRLEARAARQAKADLNAKRKMLSAAVSKMVKLGTVKARQAAFLIKRISYLNLDNPVMVDRFANYAEKIFERADYQNVLTNAFALRKGIRRLLKTDNQAQVVGMARAFAKIDPSMVDDIDAYIEMANTVKAAVKPTVQKGFDTVMKEAASISKVSEYTNRVLAEQEEMQRKEFLAQYNDVDGMSENMTLAEMKEFISSLEDPNSKSNPNKEADTILFLKERMSNAVDVIEEVIRSGFNPMTGEQVGDENKDIMSKVIKIDLDEMSIRDAIKIVEGLENFIENSITSGLEAAVNSYQGNLNAKSLVARGKTARPLRLFISKTVGKIYSEQLFSLPNLMEKMFGGVTNSIQIMKDMGLMNLIIGVNKANRQHNDIIENYSKQSFYKSKGFMDAANVYERGMIGFLKRNLMGTPQQMKAEFDRRVRMIQESINKLVEEGDSKEKKMGEIYQKVYDKLGVGEGDLDVILSKASDTNLEAVDWWINNWSEHYQDLSDVSLSVYNTELGSDFNYTTDKYKKLSSEDQGLDEGVVSRNGAFAVEIDYTDKKKTGVLMESTRPNVLPNGRYVSLDFDTNNSNSLKAALVDINTAASIRQVDGFINSKAFKKLVPESADRKILTKRINSYIRRAKGKNIVPRDTIEYINKFTNYITSLGVGKALAGLNQTFMQTMPVMINTLANAGRFDIAGPDFNEWLNKTGMPITNRGLESQSAIDSVDRRLEATGQRTQDVLNKIADINQFYLKWLLSKPDVWVARSSFKSYYLQGLKRKGISTNIDWATHEMDQEVAEYAQIMVDRQQNISDPMLAGEFLASDNPYIKITRKVILPFASFILNQKARMYNDFLTAFRTTTSNEDRIIAIRSLVGLSAELMAYQALGYGIRKMYDIAASWLLGDDDEEEKDKSFLGVEVTKTDYNATKYPVKAIFNDIISPLPMLDWLTTMGLNKTFENLEYMTEQEIKDAVKERNRILEIKGDDPMDKDAEKEFIDNIKKEATYQVFDNDFDRAYGMIGIAGETYKELIEIGKLANTGEFTDEYEGRETKKKLLPADREKVEVAILPMLLYSTGLLPKDIGTIGRKYVNKIKKKAVTEKQYERFDEVQKELGRDLKSWEIDMVKGKKEVGTAVDELNFVKRNGGLTESQGREYVKLVKLIGMPTVSDLDRIQRGEKADQILK